MGKSFFVVGMLALLAFTGTFLVANRAEANWDDERAEIRGDNVDKVGTGQELDTYPDAPLIVRQTAPIAIGVAVTVAVIGSILVLLFAIASGQRRE